MTDGFQPNPRAETGNFNPATFALHRFLQHVLPSRLQKIRHYGFLTRNSKTDLDDVRAAILGFNPNVRDDNAFLRIVADSFRDSELCKQLAFEYRQD